MCAAWRHRTCCTFRRAVALGEVAIVPSIRGWRGIVAALGTGLFMVAAAVQAEGIALGGFESSKDGNSAYVGTITPIAGGNLGQGLALRLWADYNTYSYTTDNRGIDAKASGLEAALAYQTASGENWGSISLGPRYTYTRLSPEDPGNRDSGAKWGLKIQAGGEIVATPNLIVNAFAAYTTGTEAYWARLRLLYRFAGELRTGPELIGHGNTVYSAAQVGWVLSGIKLGGSTEIAVKIGARRTEGQSTEPYGGVELLTLF